MTNFKKKVESTTKKGISNYICSNNIYKVKIFKGIPKLKTNF